MARRTRAAVSWTASLAMRCPRCFSTVFSLRVRWAAIAALVWPSAMSWRTSRSREVRRSRGCGAAASWPVDEGGEEGAGHFGAEVGVPPGDRADRQEEFLGDRPLEEVAFRAIPEGLPDQGVVGIHGEDQGSGSSLPRPRRRPTASTPFRWGMAMSMHEDVGQQPLDQRQGLLAVGRLADHLDVPRPLQEGADALADQVMIVGDDDADHGALQVGIRATRRVP